MNDRQSPNAVLVPLIAGLIGALAALLLAPRSGRETRQQLRSKAGSLKEQAADSADTVRANVEEGLARANEVKERLADVIKTKGREASDSSRHDTKDNAPGAPRSFGPASWEEEV
jgi:gas vesicle protein